MVDHLAAVVSSNSLQRMSWPISEFTEEQKTDLGTCSRTGSFSLLNKVNFFRGKRKITFWQASSAKLMTFVTYSHTYQFVTDATGAISKKLLKSDLRIVPFFFLTQQELCHSFVLINQ